MPRFSLVIPVFNRPDEVDELLLTLSRQTVTDFEVIIVEDGSKITCKHLIQRYDEKINIVYHLIENSGPALARNIGTLKARGKWLIFLDSDCFLDPGYLKSVTSFLATEQVDMFGGPDRDHESFTPIQRGISYAMTSLLTTGGIRGSKKSLEKFKPRSFNMGVSTHIFKELNGFRDMRFGEDIDLSLRAIEAGYHTGYIPEAYVYHKRRTTFKQFYKQVFNSGVARWVLEDLHPSSMKLVHTLPAIFVLFYLLLVIGILIDYQIIFLGLIYPCMLFIHASILNKSLRIGIISVIAGFIQLGGYGFGFISGLLSRLMNKKAKHRFEENFYE